MQAARSSRSQSPVSSATETSSQAFVETLEHRRFVEFCDACRQFKYIGLCYGAPGTGKTLSAFQHSRAGKVVQFDRWTFKPLDTQPIDTVFYTAGVINTPSRVVTEIMLRASDCMESLYDRFARKRQTSLKPCASAMRQGVERS